ncbi:MAG: hypothetical protein K9H16_09535, partial [Bacteroidales bacterium]|nr:hypothetical protein [Bacteroidales bacterium]
MKTSTFILLTAILHIASFTRPATNLNNFQYSSVITSGDTRLEPDATESGRNDYPPIWDQPGAGGSSMGIICKVESNPRVNNIPLEMNDFIGGFYTDDFGQLRCGGASAWPQTVGVVISLKSDNPATPEKDGFVYQEQIYFKVFSWERMKDYDVDIITFDPDSPTTDKWISLGLSEVINIQALEVFDFYISATENPICIGGSTILSANEFLGSNGNYSYVWSSDPPGFSSTNPNPPAVFPTQNTSYQLTVTDGIYTSDHEYLITVNVQPTVSVGDDALICQNEIFTATASAQNYSSIMWTTSGDGYFVNNHAFTTNYYSGTGDKANGQVFLTFTATPMDPCSQIASDFITLNIQQIPENSAGPDFQVCKVDLEGVPVEVSGENFDVIIWSTGGDGTFEDVNSASTLYFPGTMDYYFGDVDLEVCIQSLNPCFLEACDVVNISFVPGPGCAAPTVLSRCENIPIPVMGNVSNSSGPLWTTQGDGTFDDPNVTFTNYNGGYYDRLNGGTTVTLNALPLSPCTVAASKNVSLIFKPLPRLSTFGPNTDFLCPSSTYLQLNAGLNHYNSFSWTTNGDGTFTGANTLSPKYYPGTQDFQNGFFELELTANPQSPCTLSQTFSLNTIIASNPIANISTTNGSAFCGDAPLQASVFSASSYTWATTGDGFFTNIETLNPNYTPGSNDLSSPAAVTITLTAYPYCSGMNNSQSSVQLYFQDEVSVDAGQDDDFCATGPYPLIQATAIYFEAVQWTTSGDGTFSNPTILHPNYFPGANDLSSGIVQLTLTGYSIAPCTLIDADIIEISLSEAPEANAGNNATICETDDFQIQTATAQFYSSILWETSGDGTFSNPGILHPVYFPGATDISTGFAQLTLNLQGVDPCNFAVSDQQTLTIQKEPLANAGSNGSICETDIFQVQNASAQNYASILWETSGDGSFNNTGILNPLYYPGIGDKNSGSVVLTMTANAINPCTFPDADNLNLS